MLKYNNGKYRIMQITDIQDTQFTSRDTINFISAALEKENNPTVEIYDDGGIAEKLDELTAALTEKGIPYVDKTAEEAQ